VARAFSNTFAGIRPQDVTPFIIAQLIGAVMAMYVCRWFLPEPVPTAGKTSPAE
jgi:glycerol uptake facilitator-like aquaporin